MLRIKKDKNLKELEKLGFKKEKINDIEYYISEIDDYGEAISIHCENRTIDITKELTPYFEDLKDTYYISYETTEKLFELYQSDLIENVTDSD